MKIDKRKQHNKVIGKEIKNLTVPSRSRVLTQEEIIMILRVTLVTFVARQFCESASR